MSWLGWLSELFFVFICVVGTVVWFELFDVVFVVCECYDVWLLVVEEMGWCFDMDVLVGLWVNVVFGAFEQIIDNYFDNALDVVLEGLTIWLVV